MGNMKNLDLAAKSRDEFVALAQEQAEKDDTAGFAGAVYDSMTALCENIKAEMQGEEARATSDKDILLARGGNTLTSEETRYYTKLAAAMKNSPAGIKAALEDVELVMPTTIIDRVFEELTDTYPLLSEINFQNTGALIEMYLATSDGEAIWGDLTAKITAELSGAFEMEELKLRKLSAFMAVFNAYLDLGPVWLDRFVRSIMLDKLANGLEKAIVDGDGNGKPLGMTRRLTGDSGGVFPRKTPIAVTAIDPESVGVILEKLSVGRNGYRRAVPRILMVVNPKDYYLKVFPGVTPRAADGTFTQNAMPYPITVVQSGAMPEGYAVFGIANRYFMGIGAGTGGGRLEYSDEYRFLEDQRVYRIKLYGNGRALDENAFVYADIRNLEPAALRVRIEQEVPEV
ncbi:MAG: phage major capsid protein [Oscillospiraceae bacterium]|nr:phage major capsid protein [Oscillospiraceae bacterium]